MATTDNRFSPTDWLDFTLEENRGRYELPPLPIAEAATQTIRCETTDVACDARPPVQPWLEQPRVAPRILADQTAALFTADFDAPASTITSRLLGHQPTTPTPCERRAIALAVHFSIEVQRHIGNRLLALLSAHFGNLHMVDPVVMLRFISEHVNAWVRRPTIPDVIDLLDD